MNMLEKIFPSIFPSDEGDPTPEELEAKAKEERKARAPKNGPARYRTLSSGQVRRIQERSRKTHDRKVNKRHRRTFMAKQLETGVLRGQLQAAGALAYHNPGFGVPASVRTNAIMALVSKYAERDTDGRLVEINDEVIRSAIEKGRRDYMSRFGKR